VGSYKGYKAIIKQAELMAMPTEAVAAFLKKRADQNKVEWRNDPVDEDVEAALLARGDPLINLALAKFGRFIATLKPLFDAAEPSGAIRLSILSNNVVDSEIFSQFPTALFDEEEQVVGWLVAAPDEEVTALFENHNTDDTLLRDLLDAKAPWDAIPDDRLATIVMTLHRNERMWRPYDDDYMDGYAEYSYGAVFNAAWSLAGRVEPTVRWAVALSYLYDRMETDAFSIGKPLELAARWHVDPSDSEAVASEAKDVERGWLSHYQGVRKGLARLALKKDSKLLPAFLASEDPALRSAAYSDGAISPEQLSAAYEQDGELVFNQAMHNHKIWRFQQGRDALKAVAWSVVHNDKHSDLMAANIFNSIRSDLAKKHPDWFKDEEDFRPEIEASDEPATKADVQVLSEMFAQPTAGQTMEQLKQSLSALNNRLGWVWWFSLGALVVSIWRH
jgi:hypothetical protein